MGGFYIENALFLLLARYVLNIRERRVLVYDISVRNGRFGEIDDKIINARIHYISHNKSIACYTLQEAQLPQRDSASATHAFLRSLTDRTLH